MGRSPAYAKEYAAVRALVKRLGGFARGTCDREVEAMVARTAATMRRRSPRASARVRRAEEEYNKRYAQTKLTTSGHVAS